MVTLWGNVGWKKIQLPSENHADNHSQTEPGLELTASKPDPCP